MASFSIITICILFLMAYVFNISSSRTRIPSVILLLALGVAVQYLSSLTNIIPPNLNPLLPVIGTVGLILIVLEGALELEISPGKLHFVMKAFAVALIPLFALSFGIAYFLHYIHGIPFRIALSNAIPLSIVSSAIAIPSAKNLLAQDREFVTYESSLSDIIGVILFNFISLNDSYNTDVFLNFTFEFLVMLFVSFIATLLLIVFLNKINHHIKFIPIIIMVILIYAIAKVYHLPTLLFIMLFGLLLGNMDEFNFIRFIKSLNTKDFTQDVHKFKELTTEIAFLIRALFFILFGFLLDPGEIMNIETIAMAILITAAIFILRYFILKVFNISTKALVYIAPRGLITILLFLSLPESTQLPFINKSLIIQVIVLTASIMMIGLMFYNKPKIQEDADNKIIQ